MKVELSEGSESRKIIGKINNGLDIISGDKTEGNIQGVKEVVTKAFEILEDRDKSETGVTGIHTGFMRLDKATAGWQNGNYIVVAAQTKAGKSTLAMKFGIKAAKSGFETIIYSMEMSAIEIGERLIASESCVETNAMHYNKTSQTEWERISSKLFPPLWDNIPLTFSAIKNFGFFSLRHLKYSNHKVPLESSNPFLFPAIDHA